MTSILYTNARGEMLSDILSEHVREGQLVEFLSPEEGKRMMQQLDIGYLPVSRAAVPGTNAADVVMGLLGGGARVTATDETGKLLGSYNPMSYKFSRGGRKNDKKL